MTPKEISDCVDMGIPLTSLTNKERTMTSTERLRDELAYQLTHKKAARVYSFAIAFKELTHMPAAACVKIAQSIFEENP